MCEYAAERVSPALDSLIAYPSAAYSHIAYPSTQQPTLHARNHPPTDRLVAAVHAVGHAVVFVLTFFFGSSSNRPLGCYGGDGAWLLWW